MTPVPSQSVPAGRPVALSPPGVATGLAQAPTRAIAQGRAVRVCALESRPATGADLTSSLMARHPGRKAAGSVAHAGIGGATGSSDVRGFELPYP
jgi:hypothetical protein